MSTQNAVASADTNQIDLWVDVSFGVSSLIPFFDRFRPSYQLPFDPRQLMAENYVLATNQSSTSQATKHSNYY